MTEISANTFKASGDGFDFTTDGDTLTVDVGVTLLSETQAGVVGFKSNESVINSGTIYSADSGDSNGTGIALNDGSSIITNNAGALIFGAFNGIVLAGSGSDVISNAGNVIANAVGTGVGVGVTIQIFGTPTAVDIINTGSFSGSQSGILLDQFSVGGTIINSGSISSESPAGYGVITIDTALNLTTTIVNSGLINGSSNAVYGETGLFELINIGTISGNIVDADGGNDTIINGDRINGDIFLGGNSTFNGSGGTSGPIHVGGGNATITGGSGADRFVFDSALTGQFTKITNFTPKQHDKIVLSETDFTGLGPIGMLNLKHFDNGTATHANPEIVYNQSTGFLYYDSNGSHHGGLHHIATRSSHPALTDASFIVEA